MHEQKSAYENGFLLKAVTLIHGHIMNEEAERIENEEYFCLFIQIVY